MRLFYAFDDPDTDRFFVGWNAPGDSARTQATVLAKEMSATLSCSSPFYCSIQSACFFLCFRYFSFLKCGFYRRNGTTQWMRADIQTCRSRLSRLRNAVKKRRMSPTSVQ